MLMLGTGCGAGTWGSVAHEGLWSVTRSSMSCCRERCVSSVCDGMLCRFVPWHLIVLTQQALRVFRWPRCGRGHLRTPVMLSPSRRIPLQVGVHGQGRRPGRSRPLIVVFAPSPYSCSSVISPYFLLSPSADVEYARCTTAYRLHDRCKKREQETEATETTTPLGRMLSLPGYLVGCPDLGKVIPPGGRPTHCSTAVILVWMQTPTCGQPGHDMGHRRAPQSMPASNPSAGSR